MEKELKLAEAVQLAAEDCPCLFTFEQMEEKLKTIPGFEESSPSLRGTVSRLLKENKWKKVGTTGGRLISVYCTDINVPDISGDPDTKVVTRIDPDLPVKEVMEMLTKYITAQTSNEQALSNQLHRLQGALSDKTQEISDLKAAHEKQMNLLKERHMKLVNKVKEFSKEVI